MNYANNTKKQIKKLLAIWAKSQNLDCYAGLFDQRSCRPNSVAPLSQHQSLKVQFENIIDL